MEQNVLEGNVFLDIKPIVNTKTCLESSKLKVKNEVNKTMLAKLDEYLSKYFSKDEIDYIKDGVSVIAYDDIDKDALFKKYFPMFRDFDGSNARERLEPQKSYYGTTEDFAKKIADGDSEYFGGEKMEYKGNIATDVLIRIIQVIRQRQDLILKNGFFKDAQQIGTVSVGDFNIRLAKKQEYLDGLPLFIGELCKTCQVVGKSGGAYGLDYLLNPNVENLVFTKNIVIGNEIREIVVGSPAICLSKDKKKIIISAIELINTPADIASVLLRGMARALYEKYKVFGIEGVQVGIGARTLNDLGYDKFVDGAGGYPEYNAVRAQEATQEDVEKISKIALGLTPVLTKEESKKEELEKSKQPNKNDKKYKLLGCSLKADAEDNRPDDSVLGSNRDIRYRLCLCDEATSEKLFEQVSKEKAELDKKYPSVFERLADVLECKKTFVGPFVARCLEESKSEEVYRK